MISGKKFEQVFNIMKESFPLIEYREYEGQKRLLSNPRYRLLTEENERGVVAAFLAGWELEGFRFVEMIAVSPAARGGGIGKRLMERFLKQSALPVVLEVEPPEDELKRRRIGFYERLGFRLGDHKYVQPPMRKGKPELPLCIMSYPALLTEPQFNFVKEQLYREVYKA
ncbi:GNAT family N-acetyltransferase [Paenibacillus sp. M1]|uniref:GNAT family N-acetyltransferase n=1 Tax=Paenibacillus haidiansis TaxID=1574488 RepID=A0ABU7VZW7_9BACL